MIQYIGLGIDLVEAAVVAAPAVVTAAEAAYNYFTKKDDIENILLGTRKGESSSKES